RRASWDWRPLHRGPCSPQSSRCGVPTSRSCSQNAPSAWDEPSCCRAPSYEEHTEWLLLSSDLPHSALFSEAASTLITAPLLATRTLLPSRSSKRTRVGLPVSGSSGITLL